MAKTNPPEAPEYDDDTVYDVIFSRVVYRGSFKYLPRDTPAMTGRVLKEIIENNGGADCVRSAEPRA